MLINSDLRGWDSEKYVSNILEKLKIEGLIKDWRQSVRKQNEDLNGIDFQICFTHKWGFRVEVPLQVKSSEQNLNEHKLRFGQDIFAVNGQSNTVENDIRKIVSKIRRAIYKENFSSRVLKYPNLTKKQANFVKEYLKDGNSTQAAKRAGYGKTYNTFKRCGAINMKKQKIKIAIEIEINKINKLVK